MEKREKPVAGTEYGKFEYNPITISAHERPITQLKYNRDGDLIFGGSKDKFASVFYSDNGERIGTFEHSGAVLSLDVSYDAKKIVTGSSDYTSVFDVENGKVISRYEPRADVLCRITCARFSHSSMTALSVLDRARVISFTDVRSSGNKEIMRLKRPWPVTGAEFGGLGDELLVSSETGVISKYDLRLPERPVADIRAHQATVTSISLSKDYTQLVSTSSDFSIYLWDRKTLEKKKSYGATRPINDASLSPTHDYLIAATGQEASKVTLTESSGGFFEIFFFHKVLEEEIGAVKKHFGPINSLDFSPNGESFVSGGEDGTIRIHHFLDGEISQK